MSIYKDRQTADLVVPSDYEVALVREALRDNKARELRPIGQAERNHETWLARAYQRQARTTKPS